MARSKGKHAVSAQKNRPANSSRAAAVSAFSPGRLGAGLVLLVLVGMAVGMVAAPVFFGDKKVGPDGESEAAILGADLERTPDEQPVPDPESGVSGDQTVRFDWASAPAPLQGTADDLDIEDRIETSKVQAYALLGRLGSIPAIHASFYPFTALTQDRYYSALVDLTFVVDAGADVVSQICQGKAVTSGSACRSSL